MTLRYNLERTPDVSMPTDGIQLATWRQVDDFVRTTQRNFQKLDVLLQRAIKSGDLLADGIVTLAMLSAEAKTLYGDVTGLFPATTVEKIRGKGVDAPGAGQDGQVLAYNHANSDFDWTSLPSVPDVSLAISYLFDTTTAAADPGTGKIRFNNATPASVTAVYIDDLDTLTGLDLGAVYSILAADTRILFYQQSDPTKSILFKLSGAPTDSTGYWTLAGTIDASGTLPDNGATVVAVIFPKPGSGGGSTSPLTTKGDLWGYTTVDARVAVGTDGKVLTADSAASAGVSWQTPATQLIPWWLAMTSGWIIHRGQYSGGTAIYEGKAGVSIVTGSAASGTTSVLRAANRLYDTTPTDGQSIGYYVNFNDTMINCDHLRDEPCDWYLGGLVALVGRDDVGHFFGGAGTWPLLWASLGVLTATAQGYGVGFQVRAAATDTNWYFVGSDETGGTVTATAVDTGVAASENTTYFLEVRYDAANGIWYGYINGVEVATLDDSTDHTPTNSLAHSDELKVFAVCAAIGTTTPTDTAEIEVSHMSWLILPGGTARAPYGTGP